MLEAVATRVEAIASRLEAIASRLEAIQGCFGFASKRFLIFLHCDLPRSWERPKLEASLSRWSFEPTSSRTKAQRKAPSHKHA